MNAERAREVQCLETRHLFLFVPMLTDDALFALFGGWSLFDR